MKIRHAVAAATALAATAALTLPVTAAHADPEPVGIHVKDGRIYEADGTELIMRGVNHAHTWYTGQTQSFADIGSLGANTVRTVLSNGVKWQRNDAADVANVIDLAKDAKLISMLEVHDTTGYGDQYADPPRSTLSEAADYWVDLKDVLIGQEDYVMINIGNEPYGNDAATNASYVAETKAAIATMRDAGLEHTIVVDAPSWGQDWQYLMRDNAQEIYDADPTGNTVFSVHMYQVFGTPASVTNYLEYFLDRELPIIVGEFGWEHQNEVVAWEAILSESERLRTGYLGWSWSGNTEPYLDLALNFDKNNLSQWGEDLFFGPNGIQETATVASIFGGDPGEEPTDPGEEPTDPTDPGTGVCTAEYRTVGQWQGGFQGELTVTAASALSSWTLTWDAPGVTVTNSWGGQTTASGSTLTTVNEAWNGTLSAGATATVGFIGQGTPPAALEVACH